MKFNFGLRQRLGVLSVTAALACGFFAGSVMIADYARANNSEDERNAAFDRKGSTFKLTNGKTTTFHAGGGPSTTTTEIVAGQNQQPILGAQSDVALKAAQDKYATIAAQGGFPQIPSGSYKNGSKGAGVGALNKHLYIEGYLRIEGTQGEFAQLFTNATEEAVSHFQRNMGLAMTGKVDAATLKELNISADDRLRTITANIPRISLYEKDLGKRYLIVNIPAQQLETVSDGKVYSRHNVIVGRPDRPSPVVMTPLATVKFNPYWNAPVSIVERDILPKMVSGTQVLTDMNMKVFEGGPNGVEVNPNTVHFTVANIDRYLFRQEPGPHSAMATAKIEFNSTFGIYLHDTPERELFKTSNRFYSSGCIRVEKMPLLVEWVLNGQGGFGASQIATMAETLERLDVPLATPPQLRVAYLTAWPTAGGTVAFRKDIYDLDSSGFTVGQPMALGERSPDGQRYVLKPLARQVSVDAAEADNFNFFSIFGKKPASQTSSRAIKETKPKKNVFGASLVSAAAIASPSDNLKATKQNAKPKTKSKIENKSVGLFDWISYRKEQAQLASTGKKKSKKKSIASVPEPIPPEPVITAADIKKAKVASAKTAIIKASVKTKSKLAVCKPDSGKDCKLAAAADKPPAKP